MPADPDVAPVPDPGPRLASDLADDLIAAAAGARLEANCAVLANWFARALPADRVAAGRLADEALREVLPDLVLDVGHRLAELLDRVAVATLAARADGSGQAPAEMRREVYALSTALSDLLAVAARRGIALDLDAIMPSRLSVGTAPDGRALISYHVMTS